MAPQTRDQKEARLAQITAELAAALHQEAQDGRTVAELADVTGLPVGIVAGLITIGRRQV